MSREYADSKIKEALNMHGGNTALARQQIITWSYDDPELMRALARPHLDGIVSYQVDRVSSGRATVKEKPRPTRKPPQKQETPKEENFGMDLLRAVAATGTVVFGQEDSGSPVKRRAASKQHIEAIHKLASSRHNADKTKK